MASRRGRLQSFLRAVRRSRTSLLLAAAVVTPVFIGSLRSGTGTGADSATGAAAGIGGSASKAATAFFHWSASGAYDPLHIAVPCDESNVAGALAVVNSTMTAMPGAHLAFHILFTSDAAKDAFGAFLDRHPFQEASTYTISSHSCEPSPFTGSSLSAAAFALSDALGRSIEKALVLDPAALVLGDLYALWAVDLESADLAASPCSDSESCGIRGRVALVSLTSLRRKQAVGGGQAQADATAELAIKSIDKRLGVLPIDTAADGEHLPQEIPDESFNAATVVVWNGPFKPWVCQGHGFFAEVWARYLPAFELAVPTDVHSRQSTCDRMLWTESREIDETVEKFTVVIVGVRPDNFVKIASHLRQSRYIADIIVAWNRVGEPCPDDVKALVKCLPQTQNEVVNRFRVWDHVNTEAVLQHDDDLHISLPELEAGFKIWQAHRRQLLGFEPRVAACDSEDPANPSCHYKFRMDDGFFDLVIGKLFFVQRSYMEAFTKDPESMKISTEAPCEDLAMNFFVGHATDSPPLFFKGNITEVRSKIFKGLSQGINTEVWRSKRHDCVSNLVRIFGGRKVRPQTSLFELPPSNEHPVKSRIAPGLSWCSDLKGSRLCKQP